MKKLSAYLIAIAMIFNLVPMAAYAGINNDSVRAQDDYYTFVNEQWIKENPIPEGYTSWSNMDILEKKVSDNLRVIVDEYTSKKDLKENSNEKKLADMYTSVLDYENRNKQGISPIKQKIDMINQIKTLEDVNNVFSELTKDGDASFITYDISADLKNSNMNILYLSSGSLGMSDRDYYLSEDESAKKIRTAYKEYLKNLFKLKGDSENIAVEKANKVYDFEKSMAESMSTKEDANDIEKQYNVVTVDELKKMTPKLNWNKIMATLELSNAKKIVAGELDYYKKLNTLINDNNIDSIKSYLEAVILRNSAGLLTTEFEKANFKYVSAIYGLKTMRPEKERAFDLTNEALGEMLGKIYIEKYFSSKEKEDVKALVQNIIKVYENRINKLDWMSKQTKEKAIQKLNKMQIKIGYPDKWEDYTNLEIKGYDKGGSLYSNIKNIDKFNRIKLIEKLNNPVDKTEWGMTPQTINAYYNPSANEIVFPAAFLQSPMYDYKAPKVENLARIGVVIGHEISHAFDDQGSKFDADGNLVDWWTKEDYAKYSEKTKALVNEYNKFEVLPKKYINGKLTLGENIADLGAVAVALDAAKSIPNVDLKEFFKAYAMLWRNNQTDEIKEFYLKEDPHSPGKYRVNGILTNIDDFYKIYNVKSNDKMYTAPEKRIKIW